MVEKTKKTTAKKSTTPIKTTRQAIEKKVLTVKPQTEKIEVKKETKPKIEKIALTDKPVLSEIDQKRTDFDRLLKKFQTLDDPIERYMIRQEMKKILQHLKEHGVQIDLP